LARNHEDKQTVDNLFHQEVCTFCVNTFQKLCFVNKVLHVLHCISTVDHLSMCTLYMSYCVRLAAVSPLFWFIHSRFLKEQWVLLYMWND